MSAPVLFPHRPRVAVACGAILGEAPMWDARSGTLLWVDIKGHTLFRWEPAGGEEPQRHVVDDDLAFVKLTPDPDVVLLGIGLSLVRYEITRRTRDTLLTVEPDLPGNRLNDAGTGPDGSLYFGTMDNAETEPTGSFYHWTGTGPARRFGERAVVTNGPTVDGIRGLVYTADTAGRRVYVHTLDRDGTPGDRREFCRIGEGDGHPDGLTVDGEGHVWMCHWGGGRITRYTPDGVPVLIVSVPTAKVTKVAFGGPDLSTMYITTASVGIDRETDLQAGHLFAIETGVRGLPAEPCRIVS